MLLYNLTKRRECVLCSTITGNGAVMSLAAVTDLSERVRFGFVEGKPTLEWNGHVVEGKQTCHCKPPGHMAYLNM